MSEIGPALTPEEWKAALYRGDYRFFAETEDVSSHGKAALCLHGQPFGFTRAMVEALRETASTARAYTHYAMLTEEYDKIDKEADLADAAADRIEALLPPEE